MSKRSFIPLVLSCALSPCGWGTEAGSEEPAFHSSLPATPTEELPALLEDLRKGHWNARIHAVHQLGHMGPAGTEGLALASQDMDWQVRFTAVHWLGRAGASSVPALRKSLEDDPCPVVRRTALHWLDALGEDPTISPDRLREETRPRAADLDLCGSWKVAPVEGALHKAEKPQEPLPEPSGPPALKAYAVESSPELLEASFSTLSEPDIPGLIRILKTGREGLRARAADALAMIGPEAREAVDALAGALKDPSDRVRSSAAFALGNMGRHAARAVSSLSKALHDESPAVRYTAQLALESIGTPKALRAVARLRN